MNKSFIKATKNFCTFEENVPAPYIRKTFDLEFVPEAAEISICGLGFYILYINGVDVTKGLLAPYISNPDHCCFYDTYHIKKYLKKGKNAIGIILGNGMLNAFGGNVWDFEKADCRSAPMVALELSAEGDGGKLTITADDSFKVHSSPITLDELRLGEYYDANLEIEGWNLPEFDDSAWENALLAEAPKGEMIPCTAESVVKIGERKPVKILKNKNGYVYDFGVNSAGLCRMKITAKPNQKITMRHAEVLDENLELDRQGITFYMDYAQMFSENNQIDVYTAKGEGEEEYMPHFTFHGFRYVEVLGLSEEQATDELLTFYEYSSGLDALGDFECSDETCNTLFEMVKRSDRSNFFYYPMDCPHREKNGWTGDASLSADRMVLLYNVEKSFRQWLGCIRKAQEESGRIPSIVPTYGWGYEECSGPAWDSVLFNLSYVLYKYRGCHEVVRENKDTMVRYLEYIMSRRNDDGTVSVGLGDWLPVGKACTDYKTPLAVSDSIYVMDMAKKAAEMLDGIGENADFADGIYREMRQIIREKLVDMETMAVSGDSQAGQAMALYYGVFEPCEEEEAFKRLMEYLAENNDSFDCGCLGMHVLFPVLSKYGEGELAYKMITKKEFPSYAHWIDMGETTMLEQFMPDGENCGSHNHHFLGDIGRWFINH
ncbi:MAG: hypothetical protein E7417_01585, partial [Ruminococcaceae bacterium]|nr:hypothetical protein [Oscillospiraceae bacterium]